MPDEIITPESLADADQLAAAAGGGADSQNVESLTLSELNSYLGKNFPSKEAALKSVKDTFSYVGSVGQLKNQVDKLQQSQANPQELQQMANRLTETEFYLEHPEYKPYRDVVRKFGSDPAEAVKDPTFQQTFEALKAKDDAEKSKSVVHSSPRLGQATDSLSQAKEAQKAGNAYEASALAVKAVRDAFDL